MDFVESLRTVRLLTFSSSGAVDWGPGPVLRSRLASLRSEDVGRAQGYDVASHVLACFGGAGGQHACAIAVALGMKTVFVHRYAGILSAVGERTALWLQSSASSHADRLC